MHNLVYLRKAHADDEDARREFVEIEAAIEACMDLDRREAFFGKDQFICFAIAFTILPHQWSGQNSVGYYAPQIFKAIGYTGTTVSLLASGIYSIVKVAATGLFVIFLIETLGRKGASSSSSSAPSSRATPQVPAPGETITPSPLEAMDAMLYVYVCFCSMGWGPLPWVYVADIPRADAPLWSRRRLELAMALQCVVSSFNSISPILISHTHS